MSALFAVIPRADRNVCPTVVRNAGYDCSLASRPMARETLSLGRRRQMMSTRLGIKGTEGNAKNLPDPHGWTACLQGNSFWIIITKRAMMLYPIKPTLRIKRIVSIICSARGCWYHATGVCDASAIHENVDGHHCFGLADAAGRLHAARFPKRIPCPNVVSKPASTRPRTVPI